MAKSQSKAARVRSGKSAAAATADDEGMSVDLKAALGAELGDLFAQMPPSHRQEWLVFVGEAKKPATRAARIEKVVAAMKERRRKLSSRR